jgi:CRISPR-associated protein (TIGR02584 family)
MTDLTNSQKHVLVAVLGQTPQVITETLYALMIRNKPRVPLSEIYILTTSTGADIAWRILGGEQGQIARLCNEYGIDPNPIHFDRSHIITICREDQTTLDDIRTSSDTTLLASQMLGLVRQLTKDENSTLYCSIAGGRKTMSASLMLALSLYGRKQDRLTHVLISEEFETNPNFFFPPKRAASIAVGRGSDMKVVSTKDVNIELADIPFVRVRSLLGDRFNDLETNLPELMKIVDVQIRLKEETVEKLVIDLEKREATFGEQVIPVSGKEFALLAYYADTKANQCTEPLRPVCSDCRACFQTAVEIDRRRFANLYNRVKTKTATAKEFKEDESLASAVLMSNHTKLNRKLQAISPLLKIISRRLYTNTRYGLGLEKNLIQIHGVEP